MGWRQRLAALAARFGVSSQAQSLRAHCSVTRMQRGSQAEARRAAGLPVLPREVMYRIVHALSHPASEGDAASVQALLRLSAVCHIVRDWALSALYDVLVLPRHVRDFRKWYARMRAAQPPFPSIGYVRALFVGIDDVSTGHCFLRILDYTAYTDLSRLGI